MNTEYLASARGLIERARLGPHIEISYKAAFGAVAAYADGRIFITCGKFGVGLKLLADACQSLMDEGAGKPLKYFEKGHVKKNYVVLSPTILDDQSRLNALLRQSMTFAQV